MSSGNKRPSNELDGASEKDDSSKALDAKKKCKRRWGAKSRWGDSDVTEKQTVLSGLPTVIPMGLTKEQEEQYLLQLQIEEITRRLQTGELGIPPVGERSPSPEPVYNHEGKRTNTREVRTRKKLENERHRLIQKVLQINPSYRPPFDYKPPVVRCNERVFIPQDEHPEIGFIGMIIGPRGNSLRKIEKDTGCNIVIRGKGSVKEGRVGSKDGKPLPGADEPLHAFITADCEENVKKGVDRIKKIINDAINIPDEENDWMREQLRELAVINGTLRDSDTVSKLRDMREAESIVTNKILCHMCGGAGHIARDCKQRRPGESLREMVNEPPQKAKLDVEYMSLMAELGQGPAPPSHLVNSSTQGARPQIHQQQTKVLSLPAPPPPLLAPPPPPPPLLTSMMTPPSLLCPPGTGLNGSLPFSGCMGTTGVPSASRAQPLMGDISSLSTSQGQSPARQHSQNSAYSMKPSAPTPLMELTPTPTTSIQNSALSILGSDMQNSVGTGRLGAGGLSPQPLVSPASFQKAARFSSTKLPLPSPSAFAGLALQQPWMSQCQQPIIRPQMGPRPLWQQQNSSLSTDTHTADFRPQFDDSFGSMDFSATESRPNCP